MESISYYKKQLFIDGSYFVFYRFYATKTWYKLQDIKNDYWKDDLFYEKFSKMFKKTLTELVKKYGIEWNNLYFAKDCPREDIWRNHHINDYKGSRPFVDHVDLIFKNTYV